MYGRFEATGHATNGGDTGKLCRRRWELVVGSMDKERMKSSHSQVDWTAMRAMNDERNGGTV